MPGHDDNFSDLKANVLLVDDQPANLLALQAVLGELGQNLVQARSGEEALRLLQADDFAVVLLDVQMPGLGGFETARRIRGQERSRHTPIIFVTDSESDEFPVVEAYRLGAVDYLVKPLVPEILRAKVGGFVELHRKTERLRQLERQQAEREAEERFRLVVESVREHAIILLDQGGRVASWNAGAERLTGYRAEEIVGRHFSLLFTEEDRQEGMPEKELKTATATGSASDDNWVLRRDGSRFWASGFTTALGGDGGPRGFVKIVRDLTERRRLEEELRQRAEDLDAEHRRKDEFLAMLAHELRNPLAPIRNAVQVMGMLAPADDNLRRAGEVIERQVRHMTRLVDDLLDVSRVTRGKVTLHKEPLLAADVVARAVEAIRPLVAARRHELAVSLPDRPLRLEGDAVRLTQVLDNLLSNAAKYQDDGGRIWLSACREGGEAVFRVRDQGVGIPAEMLERVFDLFTQLDSTIDRSVGGLGIGLALVRSLVRMHGGSVVASSEGPGRGSEFTVRLPALPEDPPLPRQDPPGPEVVGTPARRILVVDDNVDAADSLAMVLRLAGHEVRTAHAGASGLALARTFRPEVLILDIGLPGGLNGYDLAREVRREPGLAGVLLVALTGYGQEEDRRRAQEAGFDHHLTKPAELSALQALLATLQPAG